MELCYNQAELCWGDAYTGGAMDEANIRKVCQGIKAIGGSRVRMAVSVGSQADVDRAVLIAVQNGLKPLLCMIDSPALGYNGTPESFAAECKTVAQRYGPSGSGALRNSVFELELFNESNDIVLNPPRADPATHAKYLKAAHPAIKSVHPSCTVVSGGTIPTSQVGGGWFIPILAFDPVQWYDALYKAGAGPYMDAIGMHVYFDQSPFPSVTDPQWTYLPRVRAIMDANGDIVKQIWITEFGAGFPNSDTPSLVAARDRLKAMVDLIVANTAALKLGPSYIYNYRCSTTNINDPNSIYGAVNNDYSIRSPLTEYEQTIAGAPIDPMDIVPPSAPTGLAVTSAGVASWLPAIDDVGVTVYRIHDSATGAMLCHTSLIGQVSTTIPGLTAGTPHTVYATALDAAGNESLPSVTASFTTDAPSGSMQTVTADFSISASVPADFVQIGWGFTVTGGVALPNVPTTPGDWYTIGPSVRDLQSPDHYCEITQNAASAYSDRYAMAGVRVSPDGSQGVFAFISGGGQDDAVQIITINAGVVTMRNARNATPLLPGEKLRITPSGSTYTVERYVNGVATELVTWNDANGVYSGATNRRAALAWRHKLSGSHYYPPNGTATFKAADIRPVTPSGGGGSDAWTYAVIKPSELGRVIATGLWETALK